MFELGAGDCDEHAIILCNYLLYQGEDTYIIIGNSDSEGRAAFVLLLRQAKDKLSYGKKIMDDGIQIIHPLTGQIFGPKDSFLPLKNVGIVFNPKNIWANISKNDKPGNINWNLRDNKNWKPFFDEKAAKFEQPSIQKTELRYSLPNNQEAKLLERDIEKAITSKIEE